MSDKHSIEEVAQIVDCEDLGYAIEAYLGAERIEDEELANLWKTAAGILQRIREILAPYSEIQ